MSERADAHIHLFEGGYPHSFAGRPGVGLDEAACYASLSRDYGVRYALVVAYAGQPWCAGNNAWVAQQAQHHAWVRPVAYVDPLQSLSIAQLATWQAQGWVGLSLYILDEERCEALGRVPAAVWSWLAEQRWLVSVNSRGGYWAAWQPILRTHATLRLLVAHLGLPPCVSRPPSREQARRDLETVLALAHFPGPRVKLSGFYALTAPGYAYPHAAAWPYVQALLEAYGAARLLWASDFSPCLDMLTFPQTFGLYAQMPFFSDAERSSIEGGNLLALLAEI